MQGVRGSSRRLVPELEGCASCSNTDTCGLAALRSTLGQSIEKNRHSFAFSSGKMVRRVGEGTGCGHRQAASQSLRSSLARPAPSFVTWA